MASISKSEWDSTAKARLDELEAIHRDARGSGPGRRWGTDQLNRSLFVVLVAQFQTYCRDLHDEAVDVFVAAATPQQEPVIRKLLTQGRHFDSKNPRPGALGSDFGRLGIDLIPKVKAVGQTASVALEALDALCDFRNAIAHGNESEVAAVIAKGRIRATLTSYRAHRRTLDVLVGTMDRVVSNQLSHGLNVSAPW